MALASLPGKGWRYSAGGRPPDASTTIEDFSSDGRDSHRAKGLPLEIVGKVPRIDNLHKPEAGQQKQESKRHAPVMIRNRWFFSLSTASTLFYPFPRLISRSARKDSGMAG